MDDQEMVKAFIKAWARYTVALNGAERTVLQELQASESYAREQVQMIVSTELGSDDARRRIAFQLALSEHQTNFLNKEAAQAPRSSRS